MQIFNDYNVAEKDIKNVYVVKECHGLTGFMRDIWDTLLNNKELRFQLIQHTNKHEGTGTSINLVLEILRQEAMKLHRRAK
jgi:hypothetical protein